jgi:hypothetical protein
MHYSSVADQDFLDTLEAHLKGSRRMALFWAWGMIDYRLRRRAPATLAGEIIVSSDIILGYTTLGLWLSVLAQNVARRS